MSTCLESFAKIYGYVPQSNKKLDEFENDLRQNKRNSTARVHNKRLSQKLNEERRQYRACFGSITNLLYWKQKIKETIHNQIRS